MSNNKKTPRETGLEMVRKGFITQEKFQDMVNEGLTPREDGKIEPSTTKRFLRRWCLY